MVNWNKARLVAKVRSTPGPLAAGGTKQTPSRNLYECVSGGYPVSSYFCFNETPKISTLHRLRPPKLWMLQKLCLHIAAIAVFFFL